MILEESFFCTCLFFIYIQIKVIRVGTFTIYFFVEKLIQASVE